ncbi:hypothetical protein AJ79_03392 [Helicocarpus griseus UAMH5409]|uniref:Uncharacterized protein n=1 Tax=Helicocarpus griseus UAMH5409 TaxID=1447875 RepID=A0A2B7XPW3_9EURO|nr:hypothetical protein AJ79_03392 [Helicocarpus griseus UAMH5409]
MDPQPAPTNASLSKRRRFQVPITNYFSPGDAPTDGSSRFNYSAPTYSPAPALPHKVQSSLLTVGMRVRKSVPEGYKTKTAMIKTDTGIYMSHSSAVTDNATPYTAPPPRTMSYGYTELAPFCGVLKTGNLAVQPFPRHSTIDRANPNSALDEEWDKGSIPSSSQESTDSSYSSHTTNPTPNPHKRSFEPDTVDSDNEEEYSSNFPHGFSTMWKSTIPVSAPSSSRPILHPRLGQRSSRHQQQGKGRGSGQENHVPAAVPASSQSFDFEEADFLRKREEVDEDVVVEVEMGGV